MAARGGGGGLQENSINTKMTVSQEPLFKIDPFLCQNVSCMKPFRCFEWNYFEFM